MTERAKASIIDAEFTDVPAGSAALVPLAPHADLCAKIPLRRPDASFVVQLIATAERAPQTRDLRRAGGADARAAYGPRVSERRSVTRRTKQII